MTKPFHLLYPQRRSISDHEVMQWAADEWANNAPRNRCSKCGTVMVAEYMSKPVAEVRAGEYAASDPANPCCGEGPLEPLYDEGTAPGDVAAAVSYLEDLGVATFRRR